MAHHNTVFTQMLKLILTYLIYRLRPIRRTSMQGHIPVPREKLCINQVFPATINVRSHREERDYGAA